jgi:hypothetical protein
MTAMTGSADCPPTGAVVLCPEHFGVGMTAAAINYGASPRRQRSSATAGPAPGRDLD